LIEKSKKRYLKIKRKRRKKECINMAVKEKLRLLETEEGM